MLSFVVSELLLSRLIIWKDHQPLTLALKTPLFQGIYSPWALENGALNVGIRYIQGSKNQLADSQSITIFPDPEYAQVDLMGFLGDVVYDSKERPQWV